MGLNSLYTLDAECLAKIAAILGKDEDSRKFAAEYEHMKQLVRQKLWNEKDGIYENRFWDGRFSHRLSTTNFYPLFAGIATPQQAERMIKEHLLNPQEFWGKYVAPTIARNDPAFPDQFYWRGDIWGPTNYMLYEGINRYRFDQVALEYAHKNYDLFMDDWRTNQHDNEQYYAWGGSGGGDTHYTWGALLCLVPLEQYIDVNPWEGLRFGALDPPAPGDFRRAVWENHTYDITVGPNKTALARDGQERFEADAGVVVRNYQIAPSQLTFSLNALRPVLVSTREFDGMELNLEVDSKAAGKVRVSTVARVFNFPRVNTTWRSRGDPACHVCLELSCALSQRLRLSYPGGPFMRSRTAQGLVLVGLVCTLLLVARKTDGQSSTSWPRDAPQYKLYMIGNAHIDIPWLWPWPESMSVGLSTFRAALDRMNEFPDFKFTASSAQLYEWAAAADPSLIAQIRRRVAEGRWGVVGGWWIEPDVNIPNGESLIRQGLYGQQVFQQLLGRTAVVGFNPDSFGHPGTLPQILKLQGMNSYVFMRPGATEKELPADVFWWRGEDGTRVLAYRISYGYCLTQEVQNHLHDFVSKLKEPTKDLMVFYGAGDHGGGPAKDTIHTILDARKQTGAPNILFSTPERYFHDIAQAKGLPEVNDDLQHHSVGCYTALSEIKKDNRTTEAALVTGEKMAALANVLVGFPYPKSDFTASWKKVLLMQFHDSLAGTALPEQYIVSHDAYGFAREVANQAIYRSAEKIAWQIPTPDPGSDYLVVFNPHAWAARLKVQYDLGWGFDNEENRELARAWRMNRVTPSFQWTDGQTVAGNRRGLVFEAPVPAFGYRQFRLHNVEPPALMNPPFMPRKEAWKTSISA